jgi:uncharacterized protein (DUF433 family)
VDRPETLMRQLPPCLHWHSDGEIRLAGHRIGLYRFIYYYNQGFTAEMLFCQFPTLELTLVHKVIVFYLEHRDEVDRYVTQYQAEIDRFRVSGQHAPSVTELRERLAARKLAEPVDADRV